MSLENKTCMHSDKFLENMLSVGGGIPGQKRIAAVACVQRVPDLVIRVRKPVKFEESTLWRGR
eukprot:6061989-Lingulodinium_polyedra.AAC.1